MKKITKTSLVSLAVVSALAVAPQAAFAHKSKKAHTHTKSAVKAPSASAVSSTEARLRQMEAEIQSLRSELGRTRTETKSAVASVSEKAAASERAVEAKLVEHESNSSEGKNLLFFRGGYAGMTHNRNDELLTGNGTVVVPNSHNGGAGWYIGAGLDHRLTNNLWGLTDLLAVDGEVMFEYKNFGESNNTLVSTYPLGTPISGVAGVIKNQITQFTLSASPKIKFNTGTIFTPWIIPFGLSINVISPPSSGVTVLNPGLMLGVGGEVDVWKAIVAGVDFRYNFTGGDLSYNSGYSPILQQTRTLKGMSTDGLTAGGYFGFKF
ncbi:MAG: hypothetical protein ACKN9T_19550 [Candidatus Methylumidiphilus sp.]